MRKLHVVLQGILQSSKKALEFLKRRWKWIVAIVVIGVPSAALTQFLLSEPEPEYITDVVKKGNLVQTVEAVATVISEKDLELKFPVSGLVEEVLVEEGDTVEAGQVLAKLRAGAQLAAVTSARARLTTAQAELQALEEGTRPEDIAIAEAELRNKEASYTLAQSKYDTAIESLKQAEQKLEALLKEEETALRGEVSSVSSVISKEMTVAEVAIGVVEDVFQDVRLQNIIVSGQPYAYTLLESGIQQTLPKIQEVVAASRSISNSYEALLALEQARKYGADAANIVNEAYDFIVEQEPMALFSYSVRESMKSTLATEKKYMQTAMSNISTALTSLDDKSAGFDTRIAAEEAAVASARGSRDQALADMQTFQTAIDISRAQLDLKKAGTRQADVNAAKGRVQQVVADLQKAQADYADTILTAPIAGTITKVNLKQGEFTPGQFSETVAAVTILGESPYRVEMFATEIDIPKIRYGQTGALVLDAYPDRTFATIVSEIDPAATRIDGVPKYRVKLDFSAIDDALLKIGMTGDLEITIKEIKDTIYIPARAVLKDEDGNSIVRVLGLHNGVEDRRIETGMETITSIEVLEGLYEGETIIVLQK